MEILNRFTSKKMLTEYDIEEEILSYIKQLERNLINANKKVDHLEKAVSDLKPSGRKDKFSYAQKEQIRDLRAKGVSIKGLAEHFNCSTTLIHKICKGINVDLRKQTRGVKVTTLIKQTKKDQ